MTIVVEEERKIAISGHAGTGSELRNLPATSIQRAHRVATSLRPNLRPSFFAFTRFCCPPPNETIRPPGTPKQCAHQTLRVSLRDVRPCFDRHSRRRSNALCIAPFLLSGTSPSILPYFPARPPPTEPQRYETTMSLSGHSTPHSVLLEPFHPPIGLNAAFCMPLVETLAMKENMWSFSGDDFNIQNLAEALWAGFQLVGSQGCVSLPMVYSMCVLTVPQNSETRVKCHFLPFTTKPSHSTRHKSSRPWKGLISVRWRRSYLLRCPSSFPLPFIPPPHSPSLQPPSHLHRRLTG